MHSNTKKYDIEILEDSDGNVCIQGSKSGLLALAHSILETITDHKPVELQLLDRILFISDKD